MAKVECELMTQDAIDVEIAGRGTLLQEKSVDVEHNGTIVVAPDDGFDGLSGVEINTNVPKRFECGDAYIMPPSIGATSISVLGLLQKIDVSCWDTSSVTSMYALFNGLLSLISLDLSGFDTSKVTNMGYMFSGCSSLQRLDLSGFDTSKVTNMNYMFNNCNFLQWLDLSGFDTSKVTHMDYMFSGCNFLQRLDLSGFDISKVTHMDYMFIRCDRLKSLIGDKMLADVENGTVALRGLKLNIGTPQSPLRFSSILALANGLADLAGATAQTLTISAQSYNNMYNDDGTKPTSDVIAERQARIAAICAAKNWNFAH